MKLEWTEEPVEKPDVTHFARGRGSFVYIVHGSDREVQGFRFVLGFGGKLPLSSTWTHTLEEAKQLALDHHRAMEAAS